MELKNKVLGTIAALGLSFSMLAGVATAAPDSTGSVTGHVELKAGICNLTLGQTTTDFGEFTYQNGQYVRSEGHGVMYITGDLKVHKPNGVCNVSVSTDGLVGPGGTIPTNNFSWSWNSTTNFLPVGVHSLPGSASIDSGPASGTIGIRLNSVPDSFAPGDYDGTLNVTVSKAN